MSSECLFNSFYRAHIMVDKKSLNSDLYLIFFSRLLWMKLPHFCSFSIMYCFNCIKQVHPDMNIFFSQALIIDTGYYILSFWNIPNVYLELQEQVNSGCVIKLIGLNEETILYICLYSIIPPSTWDRSWHEK